MPRDSGNSQERNRAAPRESRLFGSGSGDRNYVQFCQAGKSSMRASSNWAQSASIPGSIATSTESPSAEWFGGLVKSLEGVAPAAPTAAPAVDETVSAPSFGKSNRFPPF